jgi:hypothetical protein
LDQAASSFPPQKGEDGGALAGDVRLEPGGPLGLKLKRPIAVAAPMALMTEKTVASVFAPFAARRRARGAAAAQSPFQG